MNNDTLIIVLDRVERLAKETRMEPSPIIVRGTYPPPVATDPVVAPPRPKVSDETLRRLRNVIAWQEKSNPMRREQWCVAYGGWDAYEGLQLSHMDEILAALEP